MATKSDSRPMATILSQAADLLVFVQKSTRGKGDEKVVKVCHTEVAKTCDGVADMLTRPLFQREVELTLNRGEQPVTGQFGAFVFNYGLKLLVNNMLNKDVDLAKMRSWAMDYVAKTIAAGGPPANDLQAAMLKAMTSGTDAYNKWLTGIAEQHMPIDEQTPTSGDLLALVKAED